MTKARPGDGFVRFDRSEIEQSIPERFAGVVRGHGARTALRTAHESLSYAALDRASNRVARAILGRRDPQSEPVALLLPHGIRAVVAILGILKAGKAYVVLDPSYPESRLSYILADSGAELVVTDGAGLPLATRLCGDADRLLDLDAIDSRAGGEPVEAAISPDALAYILYTSGSTGRPKGVVQTHRNLLHAIMKYTNVLGIGAGDRLTLLPSCSTSAAVSDLFGALLNGASLHPWNVRERGAGEIGAWLSREGLTIYHSVPSLFREIARDLRGGEGLALRLVKLGGEPTWRSDLELFRRGFPADCLLYVALGATEIHNIRHFFIDTRTDFAGDVLPVGHAFEDTEVLILGESGAPVAPGEIGEIAVRSAYLSPGYWRRPDLTDRAFTAVEGSAGERIYRTGDLGRLGPDGCLEVIGRVDFQVKIRGFRVELGEIEAVLRQQPGVVDAAVVAREQGVGDRQLVAYVVAPSGSNEAELRRALQERLPEYMIPSAFVELESLPRTPNGKLDRAALPAPRPRLEAVRGAVVPRTPLEALVAGIWAEVLDRERVGVQDDFFELGGHSLLALRVCLELEKALGRRIPVSVVFGARTVEQLAERLGEGAPPEVASSLVALQARGSRTPFFFLAGPANHFGDRLGPDQPAYLVQIQDLDQEQHFTRAEDMAAHCIEAIRGIQPRGPYFLGGHCFGGIVAFEVARQLTAEGEPIALLTLFDSRVRGSAQGAPGARRLRALLAYHADRLRSAGAADELLGLLRSVRRKTRELLWRKAWNAGLETGLLDPSRDPRAANYMARTSYVPGAYGGRITLFRSARRSAWRQDDPLYGWGGIAAGGVEVHQIPGGHTGMYREPAVRLVVEKLRDCLERAQADPEPERISIAS
jgi:amino acid adenylation domain-containing protein